MKEKNTASFPVAPPVDGGRADKSSSLHRGAGVAVGLGSGFGRYAWNGTAAHGTAPGGIATPAETPRDVVADGWLPAIALHEMMPISAGTAALAARARLVWIDTLATPSDSERWRLPPGYACRQAMVRDYAEVHMIGLQMGWLSRFGARRRGRARSNVDLDALALGPFTSAAKRTLKLAEQESIRSHHSYLGSEHVVLALLQQRRTFASETLSRLPVSVSEARAVIEGVLGRNERIEIQQIIATARVKKIIELALREARGGGSTHVRTDHLLLGVLIEGQGIGAHVLQDRGVNMSWVRQTLRVVAEEGRINEPVDP